jgi:hypothetical protein
MIGPARAIRRAGALRHDALAAKCAGVLEGDRAVARVVLVEGGALMGMTEQLRQDVLALAVQFEEVERAEHGGGVVAVPADQVENGKPAFVADDGPRRRSG